MSGAVLVGTAVRRRPIKGGVNGGVGSRFSISEVRLLRAQDDKRRQQGKATPFHAEEAEWNAAFTVERCGKGGA
jgi:hypothetical protein